MRLCQRTLLSIVVVLSASLVAGLLQPNAPDVGLPPAAPTKSARASFRLPRTFHFDLYKRTFNKAYATIMEEIVRRKYVLAESWRATISAIGYKYNLNSFYLALNSWSYQSAGELKRLDNEALEGVLQDDDATAKVAPAGTDDEQEAARIGSRRPPVGLGGPTGGRQAGRPYPRR